LVGEFAIPEIIRNVIEHNKGAGIITGICNQAKVINLILDL